METDICPRCGNQKLNNQGCSYCTNEDMDEYRKVRNYIRTHPNSNAMQVANETGVSISKILKYIRDGAFMLNDKNRDR